MKTETTREPGAEHMELVVRGLVPAGAWVELFRERTRDPVTTAEAAEYREGLDRLLDAVNISYRDGKNGCLQFGTVRVNIQSFAAIDISLVPWVPA